MFIVCLLIQSCSKISLTPGRLVKCRAVLCIDWRPATSCRAMHYVKEELPGGVVSTLCGALLRGNPPQQPKPVFRTCRGCAQAYRDDTSVVLPPALIVSVGQVYRASGSLIGPCHGAVVNQGLVDHPDLLGITPSGPWGTWLWQWKRSMGNRRYKSTRRKST